MRPSQLLAVAFAVSSASAAWPEAFDKRGALGDVKNFLYGRQDDNNESSQRSEPTATETEAPRSTSKDEDEPRSTEDSKETGRSSVTGSAKATGSEKPTNTKSKKPKTTEFDERLGAGGVAMVTPGVFDGPQFYKIGDWVTFAWNYTSLSVTPTAVDILATCTANQATYTLAVNQTTEETGKVLWDTGAYQKTGTPRLLTEKYNLIIYDSNSSVSATAKAGYLAPYTQHQFSLYEPQPYVPLKDYQCATCNSGLSPFEQLTLKALIVTSGTTVVSLSYFAHSFGVL